jgi:hypothetical protein
MDPQRLHLQDRHGVRAVNARLRQLLVAVGSVVVAGAAVTVWKVNDGVTTAQLVDAGIGVDCNPVNVACPAVYCDGGACSKPRFVARRGAWCGKDGGLVLPDLPPGAEWFRVDLCKQVTVDAGGTLAQGAEEDSAFDCACSSGAQCKVPNPDGGVNINAPLGETLGPGYRFQQFGGAGCVPKSCGALANGGVDDSWPNACPQ